MSKYIYLEIITLPDEKVLSRRDLSRSAEPFISYELSFANMNCNSDEYAIICYSPKELPIIEKS